MIALEEDACTKEESEMPWIDWYNSLAKPSWTPAPATIGLIGQILYPIILITFGFVFVQTFRSKVDWTVTLPFAINLVANLIFTPIQFGMRNLPLAAVDIASHNRVMAVQLIEDEPIIVGLCLSDAIAFDSHRLPVLSPVPVAEVANPPVDFFYPFSVAVRAQRELGGLRPRSEFLTRLRGCRLGHDVAFTLKGLAMSAPLGLNHRAGHPFI
jgi:hypothetical protein